MDVRRARAAALIVDSSALLAIIFREPEGQDFAEAILSSRTARMSAASYVEVALRLDGDLDSGQDQRLDAALSTLGLEIVPVAVDHARIARDAFDVFGKGRHPAKLNFGDCLTYALAKATGEPLLFKGKNFVQTDLPRAMPGA